LVGEYNKICNQYKDISRKVDELAAFFDEKNQNKKQEKKILGIFKI